MKKKLVLSMAATVILVVSANNAFAYGGCAAPMDPKGPPPMGDNFGPPPHYGKMSPEKMEKMKKEHQKRKAETDARLKLTEEQKCICEKNRQEGREKMRPVFEDMKAKKMKINEISASNLPQEEKDKQIKAIKIDLAVLRDKAHCLRDENMKQFESILTPAQKAELEKIKQEHRKEMEKRHKKYAKPMMSPSPCKN